ncbi:hypothetical protein IQ269_14435 [Tychonema sp. LEGE 07199]|uniref:hypothetical protein n=1 Tax=unclassified Tychonema TaxID=2642144 RepID=UPI00187F4EF6|nr:MULTISPECIES: hypothetical protein [unclassified Tychonema]MBE9121969.1 hypothetical protein [Tychonema sp. LEGE 07199]MBE9132121.1 hypothetical protein [Tychonema sp. LEGE 07196]
MTGKPLVVDRKAVGRKAGKQLVGKQESRKAGKQLAVVSWQLTANSQQSTANS